MNRGRIVFVCFSLFACSSSTSPGVGGNGNATGPGGAPATCGDGTMPSLERGACVDVGPANIASGFARDGVRVVATRPENACEGTTRARLGDTSCVAIDECEREDFPPADAAFIVKPGAASSGKTVGSLEEALAQVKGKGAIIALESGKYATFDQYTPVTLVGRCAERVIFEPSVEHPKGLRFIGRGTMNLSHVTIQGAGIGLRVGPTDAEAIAEHVRFEGNGVGASADEGGHIVLRRSSIRAAVKDDVGDPTIGVAAMKGSQLEIEDSAIEGVASGAYAIDPDSHVVVQRTVVRPGVGAKGKADTTGVFATAGALIEVEESTVLAGDIAASADAGVLSKTKAPGPPSRVRIVRSEVVQRGQAKGALVAQEGASLELEDASLMHTADVGVTLLGGLLEMTRSSIVSDPEKVDYRQAVQVLRAGRTTLRESVVAGAQQLGLSAIGAGSALTLERSLVTGTTYRFAEPLAIENDGGRAIDVGDHATLTLVGSAVVSNQGTGVYVGEDAVANIERTIVDRTSRTDGPNASGHGVVVRTAQCALDRALIRGSEGAAVSFASGDAIVKATRIVDNAVGVSLADKNDLVESSSEPTSFTNGRLVVYASTFENNGERVR